MKKMLTACHKIKQFSLIAKPIPLTMAPFEQKIILLLLFLQLVQCKIICYKLLDPVLGMLWLSSQKAPTKQVAEQENKVLLRNTSGTWVLSSPGVCAYKEA